MFVYNKTFYYFLKKALDFAYPVFCINCNSKIQTLFYFGFCKTCFRRLIFIKENSCRKCGRFFAPGKSEKNICAQCRENAYYFEKCFSVLIFNEYIRKPLFAFKYSGKKHYGYFFASLMAASLKKFLLKETSSNYIIAPVPLFRKRKQQRGFNQSKILALHITKKLNLSYDDFLIKTMDTSSQTELSKKQRRKRNSTTIRQHLNAASSY